MKKLQENNICLYFHLKKGTNIIFYVEIGTKRRPNSKNDRNIPWHNTVNKFGYDIIIKFTNLSWKTACLLEIAWIKKLGRKDLGEGELVNKTNGGEGNHGLVFSIEYRNKLSEAQKEYFKTHDNPNKNKKNPWTSERNRLKVWTKEERNNMSLKLLGRKAWNKGLKNPEIMGDKNPNSKVNREKKLLEIL